MILADTSVWVEHLRRSQADLARLLDAGQILTHSAVIGELALGQIRDREVVLGLLARLPVAQSATDEEVFVLIESHSLFGRGIGFVDAHLIAATLLTSAARLWTLDRRLDEVAQDLGCAVQPVG